MEDRLAGMAGRPEQDAVLRQQGECLAARLRQLREARGWSREYLAGLSGVPVRTLVRLEAEGTAEPGFFTVAALATALDVSLDELARVARESVPGPGLVSVGYEGRSLERFVEPGPAGGRGGGQLQAGALRVRPDLPGGRDRRADHGHGRAGEADRAVRRGAV
ncbi:helix-turn-helix domain-containing protein [Carbonactinospora thermoautotrophica]|uniref:helix-turn-helix domain-containing protein n=1 Tax=Carbonactinospora thermoautotrophica TaxID=1469144 RepID=UPI003DAA1766